MGDLLQFPIKQNLDDFTLKCEHCENTTFYFLLSMNIQCTQCNELINTIEILEDNL